MCKAISNSASCNASEYIWFDFIDSLEDRNYPEKSIKSKWVNLPTSERLQWLFKTFKHLL